MLSGFPCHLDFSRRSGGSRFPRFSITFPGTPEILKSVVKFFRNRSSIPQPAPLRLAKW